MKELGIAQAFGGFHVHIGEVVDCIGTRVKVPAAEHRYLVQEAERFGCQWLASLRHSHPLLLTAMVPADDAIAELDLLLGDATVDDRAREAAKRLRALWDRTPVSRKAIIACGVGPRPYVEPAWSDTPPEGAGCSPDPGFHPIFASDGAGAGGSPAATPPEPKDPADPGVLPPASGSPRIDFFPDGTVHRGPGPLPSRPVDVRGMAGLTITAWAGLDVHRPRARATCWMEESGDGKTWVVVGYPLLQGPGRQATALFHPRERWLRATVETTDPEAELPVSVHAWPVPAAPGGAPPG